MFPVRFSFAFVGLLLAGSTLAGEKRLLEPVQQMAYAVKPAVVRVNAYATAEFRLEATPDGNGKALSVDTGAGGSGSGFVIHPDGWLLTSAHVVAPTRERTTLEAELRRNGAIAALLRRYSRTELRALQSRGELEPIIAELAGKGRLSNVVVTNRIELSNGSAAPFEVALYSDPRPGAGNDVALLHVPLKGLPSLRMADSDRVHLQDDIWAVGYPAVASSSDPEIGGWLSAQSDLEATFNPGIVTAIKRDRTNAPLFQSNVAIYAGNSGGPAVNRAGEVIGLSTWSDRSADQIKFLVPSNVARALPAARRIPLNVESPFTTAWRSALSAAANDEWREAREHLQVASKLFPNSPDVARFIRDADDAIARSSPIVRYRSELRIVAMALLLLAIIILVRRLTRRQPRLIIPPVVSEILVTPEQRHEGDEPRGLARGLLGRMTVLNGERAGERYGLGGSGIRIGRESRICEIVLDNPKVSRLHAEVVSLDGRVLLIDRNSSNGTYVNDQKVDRRFLKDGDIIYFGGRNAIAVAFHAASA